MIMFNRGSGSIRAGRFVGEVDDATRETILKYLPRRTDDMPAWASRAVPLVMLQNGSLLLDLPPEDQNV